MHQFFRLLLASIFLACQTQGFFFRRKNWPVQAVGKVTCDGKPMPYIRIDLMDEDFFLDDKMGTTKTTASGSFRVKGSGRDGFRGKPDPYIRVKYSYSGQYGNLKIVRIFKIVRRERSSTKSYSKSINFGQINFANIHCRSYIQFYKVLRDYKLEAKSPLPYSTLYIRTKALLHGGTPYTTTNVVSIPRTYTTLKYETALHEFAHSLRHSFDGSLFDFLYDVARYRYAQSHHCGKKTNNGFAFNEGWAAYWSGSCKGNYGSKETEYNYEGNVAKALRALQKKCRSSLYRMIRVLRYRKRRIHTFYDFNDMHNSLYSCKL